ncbi:MAG: translation initiation factor IF-3 [Nitrospirae bacterium CG_4_10_14_3_um_filter_44_29]|nr:translation initiation factor IF-3 [Nitrospirota bacterium]PIP70244.1 MAG: translation initiation factor IF-3 [Nitrospirae bacterium CG22_combo_CG10-13_8_21_14_all_44_11]PIV40654.1 MAG: translation initiation factor IF-3 [Nitrospirae bacterium CG02_land_8_20_14_3_00_44_33]PIV67139.1 MAG: translation initiation factor IF-3 [Nitrospirae bacterium CG01_land_8_20_14_3_00_44_22]PIW89756.1 MAG: translation initiation factor IF-3 [Nitrospirae bacterium CG_4_8_14_3_um_filter_44_28]PIX89716.1 MAG: t
MRVNEQIRAKEVRLIDGDGAQVGIVSIREALELADKRELDLVEVSPDANPPVCKLLDFGKYKYQISKKQAPSKKIDIKEIKVRPHIGAHDLELKVRNMRRFLDEGHKAKVMMFFRGREMARPELGLMVFEKMIEMLTGKFNIELKPKLEGNHITMVIGPSSK